MGLMDRDRNYRLRHKKRRARFQSTPVDLAFMNDERECVRNSELKNLGPLESRGVRNRRAREEAEEMTTWI